MRLVVFPNDTLRSVYEKGEVKIRYWNPQDIFDEIHVISLCNSDISPDKVQMMAGKAKLVIHAVGRPNYFLIPYFFFKIRNLVSKLKPDIIRTHNPSLMGALAVFATRKTKIPVLISIHSDYNPWRNFKILSWSYFPRIFRDIFSYCLVEPYSYKGATKIYSVYDFAALEARKYRNDVEIIYNRVYDFQFKFNKSDEQKNRLKIINVGRHILGKNPENLIRAIEGLDDFELLLIGEGPLTPFLKKLVDKLNLQDEVNFIPRVVNTEINYYYQKCDIFAINLEYGGVSIPEIEAMASGLPIVISKPLWGNQPELVNNCAIVVENSTEGFRNAFIKLKHDLELRNMLGEIGRKKFETMTGEQMELREASLYRLLLNR